jgi:hypothetical protein
LAAAQNKGLGCSGLSGWPAIEFLAQQQLVWLTLDSSPPVAAPNAWIEFGKSPGARMLVSMEWMTARLSPDSTKTLQAVAQRLFATG